MRFVFYSTYASLTRVPLIQAWMHPTLHPDHRETNTNPPFLVYSRIWYDPNSLYTQGPSNRYAESWEHLIQERRFPFLDKHRS